jgi:hypothetical protein
MREQMAGSDRQVVRSPESETLKIKPTKPVTKSKTDVLHKLLSRRNGATVAQIQKCMIWQPHTVRAAISRLRTSGVTIELDRSGKVARYRAMSAEVVK